MPELHEILSVESQIIRHLSYAKMPIYETFIGQRIFTEESIVFSLFSFGGIMMG